MGDVEQRWAVNGIGIVIDTSAGHACNCVRTYDDGEAGLQMVKPQTTMQWSVASGLL